MLTGDIHSSWAMDIPAERTSTGYTSAGVESVCPSVTSDGFYELVRASPPGGNAPVDVATTRGLSGTVAAANPWVRYLDGIGHGYTLIDVTPEPADRSLPPTGLRRQLADRRRHPQGHGGEWRGGGAGG